MSLTRSVAAWLYGHLKSLLLIVVILLIAHVFQRELREYLHAANTRTELTQRERDIAAFIAARKDETARRLRELEKAGMSAVQARIRELDAEIAQREAERAPGPLDVLTGNMDAIKRNIALELLRKERDHLQDLVNVHTAAAKLKEGRMALEQLRREHAAAYAALKTNEQDQAMLRNTHPAASLVPGSRIWQQLQELRAAQSELYRRNQAAHEAYQRQRRLLLLITVPQRREFEVAAREVEQRVRAPFDIALAHIAEEQRRNWVSRLAQPLSEVLPLALLILLPIVFAPLLVKAFLYHVVAPAASRRPPVTLLPEVSGEIAGQDAVPGAPGARRSVSSVSVPVMLGVDDEMLIHAEYLQSSANPGGKRTKWLLDWRYPLTSLASGMFALTRIRPLGEETYVVSSTQDPFSELGLVVIPDGSAVVLQPRSLAGIVQRRDRPTRITRHWRLSNLSAWLTLQLRYLVFHGPTTLIVKGCRGIQIERAGGGRSINQAATIGYTANLAYATLRCETFAAYLMGKQALFNDSFAGDRGYFLYEEMPRCGQKTGFYGRGVDGIFDAGLKIFGI